jgi:hypothetical protein
MFVEAELPLFDEIAQASSKSSLSGRSATQPVAKSDCDVRPHSSVTMIW